MESESKLTRWCDGLIEAGWLAAIIVTPLFFNIHSSRVFEPDKLTMLRSIAVVMSFAWLVKFIDLQGWQGAVERLKWKSKHSIWRMPFVLPVFLIVIAYLLSTIFSVTRSVSLAGSYQRLQGTYTTFAYIVVFVLMLNTMRTRAQVSRLITTAIITTIPVSLYAMLQHFGLDPLPWGGNVQRRVAGHMGNSIFIAAYLIMVVPLTIMRIIDAFTNILSDEELSYADVIRSSIYIFALAIQIIAIFWTRSRGPFLGLGASVYAFVLIMLVALRNAHVDTSRFKLADGGRAVLFILLGSLVPFLVATTVVPSFTDAASTSFAFFIGSTTVLILVIAVMAAAQRGWRWLWLSWILLAIVLVSFLGLFNVSEEAAEPYLDTPVAGDVLETIVAWRDLPEIGRFGSLLEAQEGSGRVRVLIWEGVLDLLAIHEPIEFPNGGQDDFNFLRPLIGYGPESMYVAYNRFYPPELATIEARNASPDRAHNETFDSIVITGLFGFLAWQALYLSVFYYGFRWLGVVRSKRDRNVLIGLWIGGAAVSGVAITSFLGLPFLGVAIPFGTIIGFILYLIYYAISAEADEHAVKDPFATDYLLMVALVAGVLAHYVEIHFGIAIASTRTHFFAYIGLMFILGYLLPRYSQSTAEALITDEAEIAPEKKPSGRKRRRRAKSGSNTTGQGWAVPVLAATLMMALIIGILGYNFITFSLPQGQSIQTIADVPSAAEIFHQSMFVNPSKDFSDSPFVFLLLVLTWSLGCLVTLSEMFRRGRLSFFTNATPLEGNKLRIAGAVLAGQILLSMGFYYLLSEGPAELNRLVGTAMLLAWGVLSLLAIGFIFLDRPQARTVTGFVALIGLVFSLPVITAGAILYGLIIAVGTAVVLYLIWDSTWNNLLLPAAIMTIGSFVIGLVFVYVHAYQIRAGILPPAGITASTTEVERRVLEANQSMNLLTVAYIFLFTLLAVAGTVLAFRQSIQTRRTGSTPAFIVGLVLLVLGGYIISATNMRIIQADIVYKRADPWDKQAARSGNPELWDNAIAIYERAIELAPVEDFYYLWLGRAYLELSSVTQEQAQQAELLATAEERLVEAQDINPLNTDHTANLARLNTRWAELVQGDDRESKTGTASTYYEDALKLSPHNSVIWNEYARLAYILQSDCEQSVDLYNQSIEVDPFFANSYFDRAEIYLACGNATDDSELSELYNQAAAASLEAGLERQSQNPRRWLQLAEFYTRQSYDEEGALRAYEQARALSNNNLPAWQLDFTVGQWFAEAGNMEMALDLVRLALAEAPDNAKPQIQNYLDQLTAGTGNGDAE